MNKPASETSNILSRKSNISEITEYEYHQLLKDFKDTDFIKLNLEEIDTFKCQGYNIKYFYDTKRKVAYYDFFMREPIGYKR